MPVRLGRFEMPKSLTKDEATATETYAKFIAAERVAPSGTEASPSGFVSAGNRRKLRGDADPSGAAPLGRGGGRPSGCVPSGGRSNSRPSCSFPRSASASLRVRRGRHGGLRVPSGARGLRRENPLARGEGRDERSRCGRRVGLTPAIPREGDTTPRCAPAPSRGRTRGETAGSQVPLELKLKIKPCKC
jgi:hypothetical protein